MLLFVGLGNPGAQYAKTRHNIGFMVVGQIARRHRFPPWREAFHGMATKGMIDGEPVLLLLPHTFMNDSGRAVAEASHFFKIEAGDVDVFHDEVDLPPAKLRMKVGGRDTGHNGLRSVTAHIGNNYKRVRIGVGKFYPKGLAEHYVLQNFPKDEWPWVETICEVIADNADLLAKGEDASFQNKVHLAMDAKGFGSGADEPDDE